MVGHFRFIGQECLVTPGSKDFSKAELMRKFHLVPPETVEHFAGTWASTAVWAWKFDEFVPMLPVDFVPLKGSGVTWTRWQRSQETLGDGPAIEPAIEGAAESLEVRGRSNDNKSMQEMLG